MKSALLVLGLSAMALSGCAVVSDAPLFGADQASPRPLADGLWALSGPGCEVRANLAGDLPDCAIPVSIEHGVMHWDTAAALVRTLGGGARALSALPMPKTSAFRLIDGDPDIIEVLNGETNQMPPPPPGTPPRPPLKPSYLALKVVHAEAGGRIDRAVMWPVLCPPEGDHPGFDVSGPACRVQTVQALRERAGHLPPGLSYDMTWIRAAPVAAKSG
ncbi:MAG: hypothetical protein J7515_18825 [Caulobacter sp.]|nr:hypothetical protein [Caulobacter sp.]